MDDEFDHDKEPLFVQDRDNGVFIKTIPGEDILRMLDGENRLARANRIGACVNACRGIQTAELERAAMEAGFFEPSGTNAHPPA
jgi:hypothetical protein